MDDLLVGLVAPILVGVVAFLTLGIVGLAVYLAYDDGWEKSLRRVVQVMFWVWLFFCLGGACLIGAFILGLVDTVHPAWHVSTSLVIMPLAKIVIAIWPGGKVDRMVEWVTRSNNG